MRIYLGLTDAITPGDEARQRVASLITHLERAYEEAKRKQSAIQRVAEELVKRGRLTGHDIAQIFSETDTR